MTVNEARAYTRAVLKDAGVPDPEVDGDILVMEAASLTREQLFFCGKNELEEEVTGRLSEWIKRRQTREPLQHILGSAGFYGRDFIVNKNVLIPRPETEILVEHSLRYIKPGDRVLDLFTGSGCIAISIFAQMEGAVDVTGADISGEALKVAEENARKHRADIRFIQGDVFAPVQKSEKFDIITANPPYIRESDLEALEPEVRLFDPDIALTGGEDGLFFYREIANGLGSHLAPGGRLIMEIGWDEAEEINRIFSGLGYNCEQVVKDYADLDRVMIISR